MQISDPRAIRALAHPLRLDLLELLARAGPATAAQCGRILGVGQANCSFHLRQLAKYGLVEDAGPARDRRERTWQVIDPRPTIRVTAGSDALVGRQLERIVVERETQAILDSLDRPRDEHDTPGSRTGIVAAIATVTAEEAAELQEKWKALLEPYIARTGTTADPRHHPGQRHVRYFMAATPMPTIDTGEQHDGHDH
ncbi:winged helix-turn-helix domain-containing protein [Kitasatospora nipponensis]